MRTFCAFTCVVCVLLLILGGISLLLARYHWAKDYGSEWSFADRAATIEGKLEHIEKFTNLLETGRKDFADNAALFLQTPAEDFEKTMEAVRSLRDRLRTIKTMDASSFQYQTAIQQITEQEMGEADEMLRVLFRCYAKETHIICYWMNPVGFTVFFFAGVFALCGMVVLWDD